MATPDGPTAAATPAATPVATKERPSPGSTTAGTDKGRTGKDNAKTRRFRRARPRQARVVVRKVGPWSVLKLSLLFYICVMVVIMGALVILYQTLKAIGALESVTELIRDLFADQNFEIHGDWLFTRGVAVGIVMVVLWTLINVFVAFLYNLISDIVGGIEVTLSERR
jgi:hypothetical protein